MPPAASLNKTLYKQVHSNSYHKIFSMSRFLIVVVFIAGLVFQSCSKKDGTGDGNGTPPVNPGTGETATMKLIPDSMFRVYLKANVCPNAFDATGKLIDITNSEVKNFTGTMKLDTFTCPKPYCSVVERH
jgi:hypothetical protein